MSDRSSELLFDVSKCGPHNKLDCGPRTQNDKRLLTFGEMAVIYHFLYRNEMSNIKYQLHRVYLIMFIMKMGGSLSRIWNCRLRPGYPCRSKSSYSN